MIKKQLAIKNHIKETHLFHNRTLASLIIISLLFLILITRLIVLQLIHHHFYSTLSQHNIVNIIPIEPNRGLIYDRNGVLLAKDIPTYTLAIIPNGIKNLDQLIEKIGNIIPISQQDIRQFHHTLAQYRPFQPVPLKLKLSDEEVARFYVDQYQFPGVLIETHMMRYYPLGNFVSDVLGYVGRINQYELQKVDDNNYLSDADIGKMGIEKYYEKELHGLMGSEEAEIDASGRIIRPLEETLPKPGKTLYLTIDSQLQEEAEKVLGNESGAIVVLQVQTGQVLALVSKPSYDPNPFVSGLSQQSYQELLNSPLHPLYNRAIRGQFAAGSTIKPFFALKGLDEGIITPSYQIFDPGWFQLPNTEHVYRDWKKGGHGWVNMATAIMASCDIFFYSLAVNMGVDRLDQVLQDFAFGQLTGIDMPEEVPGLVPSPAWKMGAKGHSWYTGDTIEIGIGQGFLLVTPLQLAQAVSTIANRGKRFKPYLLLKAVSPDGTMEVTQPTPEPPVTLHNPNNWNTVIQAMQGVVSKLGTAYYFGPHSNFTIAAKTGTAQVYGHSRDEDESRTNIPKQLRNNHLFIAFAPVDNPQIAIAVVVEHSALADSMAGQIMRYYFNPIQPMAEKPK